jgi:phosphoglycerate-specific signal transduction histidine kinase
VLNRINTKKFCPSIAKRGVDMPPTARIRVDSVCLKFLHELTEPLGAIACYAGAARRLLTSEASRKSASLAESLEQIPLEMRRASDVIKRFRSNLQQEAKRELDSVEKKGGSKSSRQ